MYAKIKGVKGLALRHQTYWKLNNEYHRLLFFRKHKENVKFYYQKWMEDQAQNLIDATTAAFKAGKLPGGAMVPPPMGMGGPPMGMPPPGKNFCTPTPC